MGLFDSLFGKPKPKKKSATKSTATKTSAKSSAKSTAKGSSSELRVAGSKKIETLQKEFNKKYPYLSLGVFYSYARQQVAKGERITPIDGTKLLSSVRRANSGGDVTITGNKKVKSLEGEFDTVYGLYVQICYTTNEGKSYYTSGELDNYTLSALNDWCATHGCKKGVWKTK